MTITSKKPIMPGVWLGNVNMRSGMYIASLAHVETLWPVFREVHVALSMASRQTPYLQKVQYLCHKDENYMATAFHYYSY